MSDLFPDVACPGCARDAECDSFHEPCCDKCSDSGSRGRTLCLSCVLGCEGLTLGETAEMKRLAAELLTKSGWSGADLDFLHRCAAGSEDDPDALQILTELLEQREREEALRR